MPSKPTQGKENSAPFSHSQSQSQSQPTPNPKMVKARVDSDDDEADQMQVDDFEVEAQAGGGIEDERDKMDQDEEEEDEGDSEDDDAETQRGKKDKKRQRVREVRAGYRALQEGIDSVDLGNTTISDLHQLSLQAGQLFKKVEAPSEAILDSRVLIAVSEAGKRKAHHIKLDSNAFDTDEYIMRLGRFLGFGKALAGSGGKVKKEQQKRNKRNNAADPDEDVEEDDEDDDEGEEEDELDELTQQFTMGGGTQGMMRGLSTEKMNSGWIRVGRIVLGESRRIPGRDYMNGALKMELKVQKVRTQRQKQKVDESQRVRGEELGADDIAKDPLATDKMVAMIKNVLDVHVPNSGIPYLQFIINPDSFAQTVENMFYFAFCIKLGDAAIVFEDDETSEWYGDYVVYSTERGDEEGGKVPPRCQLITELTQDVWERAIKAYEITESIIPTRAVYVKDPNAKW